MVKVKVKKISNLEYLNLFIKELKANIASDMMFLEQIEEIELYDSFKKELDRKTIRLEKYKAIKRDLELLEAIKAEAIEGNIRKIQQLIEDSK